jgi:hypothetical protein
VNAIPLEVLRTGEPFDLTKAEVMVSLGDSGIMGATETGGKNVVPFFTFLLRITVSISEHQNRF